MRLLIYSDLQADTSAEMCFNEPGTPLQIFRVRKLYRDLWRLYQQHACDGLVDLGDTFDNRSAINCMALDAVLEGLALFPQSEWNIKLTGNHDQYLRDGSISTKRLFASLFAHVVDATERVRISGSTCLLCAAYPASEADLEAWLLDNDPRHMLLGHFQVKSAGLQKLAAAGGLSKSTVNRFRVSLLGHVHKPQQVWSNTFYVGSPFQQNFGEKGETKFVGVLDTQTGTVEWIPLTGYPEYRVCTWPEFQACVKIEDEHRYQVYLASEEESGQFLSHPLADRAQGIVDYQAALTAPSIDLPAVTRQALMQRYVAANPINGYEPEALLAMGLDLAGEATAAT